MCKGIITQKGPHVWPPGVMATRLTTTVLSGDCRFDPCGGHFVLLHFNINTLGQAEVRGENDRISVVLRSLVPSSS